MKKQVTLLLICFSFLLAAGAAAQTTVHFKPDSTEGQDAYIQMFTNNCIPSGSTVTPGDVNYGNDGLLSILSWTWNAQGCPTGSLRTFIKFTGLNTLPHGATVNSATLILSTAPTNMGYGNGAGNSHYPGNPNASSYPPNPGYLKRVMPGTANYWDEDTITWNLAASITLDPNNLNWVTIPASTCHLDCSLTLDVTDIVSDIVNDINNNVTDANNGFALMLQQEQFYRGWNWASSNYPDSTYWPELIVNYTACDTPDVTVLPNPACAGETIQLHAENLNQPMTYQWTGPNGFTSSQQSPDIPAATTAASGAYTVTGTTADGCAQSRTVDITVNPVYHDTLTTSICEGDFYDFDGQKETKPGVYTGHFKTVSGCDSIVTLNLFINPVYSDTIRESICEGTSYLFDGQEHTTEGFYADHGKSSLGCDSITVLDLSVIPLPAIIRLGNDTVLCNNEPLTLRTTPQLSQASYKWNTGAGTPTLPVNASGEYWVRVTDKNGCVQSDTIGVTYVHVQQYLGEDTTLCRELPLNITMQANVPAGANVLWSTGETTPEIHATEKGTYWVTVTYPPCRGTDTVQVNTIRCDCRPQMPSAFSPNGDGLNDVFSPVTDGTCPIQSYDFRIYNRYGQLVYSSNKAGEGWDGTYGNKGKPADVGTYMYILSYRTLLSSEVKVQRGNITLLR